MLISKGWKVSNTGNELESDRKERHNTSLELTSEGLPGAGGGFPRGQERQEPGGYPRSSRITSRLSRPSLFDER